MNEKRLHASLPVWPEGACRLDENNPYEAPGEALTIALSRWAGEPAPGGLTYVAWIFVFAINMAIPLLFSASVTEQHGRLGM